MVLDAKAPLWIEVHPLFLGTPSIKQARVPCSRKRVGDVGYKKSRKKRGAMREEGRKRWKEGKPFLSYSIFSKPLPPSIFLFIVIFLFFTLQVYFPSKLLIFLCIPLYLCIYIPTPTNPLWLSYILSCYSRHLHSTFIFFIYVECIDISRSLTPFLFIAIHVHLTCIYSLHLHFSPIFSCTTHTLSLYFFIIYIYIHDILYTLHS